MVTVNERLYAPQATTINGVDAGGVMSIRLEEGFDNIIRSAPDGLEGPVKDKEVQRVRGQVVSQDWVEFVNLLNGTLGTKEFWEQKSGVAPATGYVKHTITNPVIHKARIVFNRSTTRGQYATVAYDFECRAEDETKGIADMHAILDDQAAPTYVSAAHGGFRIISAAFDTDVDIINIYHVTRFEFEIAMQLVKECNDSDVGYTCVDARFDGLQTRGILAFQDAEIAATQLKAQQLVVHASDQLLLTVKQGQGAANQTITMLGVDFNDFSSNSYSGADFTEYAMNYDIANSAATPLTLAGTNKIIAIA